MAEESTAKKDWTEEERLALAAKLDAELDEFIESLEKKRYAEGWPEDRWQEEMEKHPFFMKKTPQPGDEVHPMFEGLQKLKYDPEENTKEELALNYKEDGNFYMKHKKYRTAIYSYTEGLKTKCENPEVLAALYNNRSAAQFFLKNYRSALADAQKALEYKPDYLKAALRAATCAYESAKFDLCTELCDNILENDPDNNEVKDLLKKNKAKKLEIERDERKQALAIKKRKQTFQKLCDALKERNIEFDDLKADKPITEELLRPKFLPLEEFPVHFDEEDPSVLVWPAAFSYPEFMFSDFQQEIPENATMKDCLNTLLKDPLPCDHNKAYTPDTVNVYYENRKDGSVHTVYPKKTIKSILNEQRFFVSGGALLFYIVPKNSRVEEEYINQKRRPFVYT